MHEDITTLAVEGGESAGILFTSENTAFDVGTGTAENRRLLEAGEVTRLTAADFNGTAVPPDWNQADVNSSWALRYKTNIVVKAASKTYTFRLTDKKGLSSSPVSASTSNTKAQDAQLFDGTTEISGTGESSPYSMNAELSAASVSVTARTTTADAKITGRLEKPNDSSWVPRTIDSGPWSSIDIPLTAPAADQEALYKITVAAGGDGFDPGTEKVFYVKVTKNTTISINPADNTTWGGQPSAWDALKATVENGSARVIIVDGTITAPGANKQIEVKRTVKIMGKTGKTNDKLNADDKTFIFDIWPGGNLSLEKLTLQKGKNTNASIAKAGGAIYCGGGKLNTDDVIIEECTAKNGGGIYAKNVAGTPEIKLTATTIRRCEADRLGGGICIEKGTLTLENATIGGSVADGNKAKNGGGIYVAGAGSTGEMTDGEISFNEASNTDDTSLGGGICIKDKASFTMKRGTINYNKSTPHLSHTAYGGGVCVVGSQPADKHASFTLQTGTINHNTADYGGGVMADNGGEFTMTGGNINDNEAKVCGGGVAIHGAMKMTEGTINQNKCTTTDPTFGGGGIFLWFSFNDQVTLNMTGGTISGNNTVSSSAKGAGVLVKHYSEVKMQMSGAAKIDTNNDVYLSNDSNNFAKITLSGPLSQNPAARITPETYGTTTQVLEAGTGVNLANEAGKFTVTPQTSPLQNWKVDSNGKLKKQ